MILLDTIRGTLILIAALDFTSQESESILVSLSVGISMKYFPPKKEQKLHVQS